MLLLGYGTKIVSKGDVLMDMLNRKFGKLTVLKEVGRSKQGILFECLCECGNTVVHAGKLLRSGNNKSCGCIYRKHGKSHTPIYQAWCNMKRRCNNPTNKSYSNYGGRGISYDPHWEEFNNFLEDMKDSYRDDLTLDRIDVNGNYSKENCRWANKETQANNTTTNRFITYRGETLTVALMARKYGLSEKIFKTRFNEGWSVEKAIETPLRGRELISYNGIEKEAREFANEYGIPYLQLKKRLNRGWDIERALKQPLRKPPTKK